ncbi:MAG: hypothetical protein KKD63_02380 [Proteobacteria bacterium]|nr:hypothetical protein [Desulfobulbaceae bacterium]MBU4151708.1 hypothetical protein [Pseudomonadota bacterium]
MSKKVCFIPRHNDYVHDSMRSALGLAVENMYSFCAIVDITVPALDDYNRENLDWIRDMEGEVYSNVDANVETNDMAKITLEELGQKLREMDIIVPYGIV